MSASHYSQAFAIFGRGSRGVTALYLYENDLKSIPSLCPRVGHPVMFANSNQVNNPA